MLKKIIAVILILLIAISILTIPVTAAPYKDIKIGSGKTVIEAEDYDTDDWYDTGSDGSYAYRPDGAQTEYCYNFERDDAPDDNYNIGWSADGEWVQYTVNVEKAGTYKFEAWLASAPSTGGVEIFYDGKSIGAAYAEESYDWQDWGLYSAGQTAMTAGKHIIKVEFTANVNLDAVVVTLLENGAAVPGQPAGLETAVIEAENIESGINTNIDVIYAGYPAAQDLADSDKSYMLALTAAVISLIALGGAGAAIVISLKSAGKIK